VMQSPMAQAAGGSQTRASFSAEQISALESDRKLAVVATLDPGELPHVTLITSLQAKDPERLMFGQFCEGRAKANLKADPRAGFLVLDGSGRVISGTARWSGDATSGADYEAYNRKPMFRYNAYSGIHRVHYLELLSLGGDQQANFTRAAAAGLINAAARLWPRRRRGANALTPWALRHLNSLRTLKFASVVAADGYPRIAALLPCAALGRDRLVFGATLLGMDTGAIEAGAAVAVLGLNLQFESVLVRGRVAGFTRSVGLGRRVRVIEIEEVYNSMPFKQGPIYPMPPLAAVTSF